MKTIDDLLATTYLAGKENGLSRRISDPAEINHRKEAYLKNNPAYKEVKQALSTMLGEILGEKPVYEVSMSVNETIEVDGQVELYDIQNQRAADRGFTIKGER